MGKVDVMGYDSSFQRSEGLVSQKRLDLVWVPAPPWQFGGSTMPGT